MAQSWRIKTVETDNTEKTTTSTPIIGASVIISPKGPNKFVKFNKGDTQGVLNTFGYPSKDYPSIQDALDIINKCSMYFASPYASNGVCGGVFVTKEGTISFNQGVSASHKQIANYSEVSFVNQIGISDGITTTYTYKVDNVNRYNKLSLKLYIDGAEHTISISTNDDIETLSDNGEGSILDSGCTFNTTSGDLVLNLTSALPNGNTISIGYTMDMSDTYFVLFDKNPQEDDLQVQVSKSADVDNAFEIVIARYDPINLEYVEVSNSPFLVGLSETSKDSYGDNIYIENVFGDNQQLFDAHVVNSIIDTFTDDETMVNLNGGSRGDMPTQSDVASIYTKYLKDTSKYQIKFCMDATCDINNGAGTVANEFLNIRINYQKRCRFLYATANVSGEEIIDPTKTTTYNYGITDNRGLYQYCMTWGIHKDIYQGNDFMCSNIGLIAGTLVDAMNAGYGYANAWIPENGVGGLLGGSVTKLAQEGTAEDVLEQLDNLNFNPIVNDYNYGAMIVGWRTRQVKKTIFSNIPQSSLADNIIELIEKEVMPNRIGKLIDEASYSVVRSGVNNIMSAYSNFFEDYYVWCDGENNTPEMREKEILVITLGVTFKNIARQVILNFVTTKSGTNVEEYLKQG